MKSIQWSRSFISLLAISSLLFAILIAPGASSAGAGDDCPFGKSNNYGESSDNSTYWTMPDESVYTFQYGDKYLAPDGTIVEWGSWAICSQTPWDSESNNDGFTSISTISMASDPYESGIYVSCEKKKLSVYLSIEYANSRAWRGIGQYKIDSGKISNFPYTVTRNFNGIYLDNPKTFIADLVKAKNKFTFKVSSSNGSVLSFPKNDFLSYRSKFAKLGCKF